MLQPQIVRDETPADLAVFERSKDGNFYGYVVDVLENGDSVANQDNIRDVLRQRIERAVELNEQASDLQDSEIGAINYQLNQLRLERRSLELAGNLTAAEESRIAAAEEQLREDYQVLEEQLFALREKASRDQVQVRDMRGETVTLPMYRMLAVHFPNDMGFFAKLGHFFVQIGKFVSDDPREANTEGGCSRRFSVPCLWSY